MGWAVRRNGSKQCNKIATNYPNAGKLRSEETCKKLKNTALFESSRTDLNPGEFLLTTGSQVRVLLGSPILQQLERL
jgi:hypothetical protein